MARPAMSDNQKAILRPVRQQILNAISQMTPLEQGIAISLLSSDLDLGSILITEIQNAIKIRVSDLYGFHRMSWRDALSHKCSVSVAQIKENLLAPHVRERVSHDEIR